jgi:lipopolysaccharide export system permease protein
LLIFAGNSSIQSVKKFYLFILKNYLKAFIPTFLIVMLILLMQIIWLYVDELVGKGLDWYVIAELLFYFSASLIPQALPLSVLLSSIMTFGNLGESYELVAAKASGISIWRMFKPMLLLMFGIALFGFFVSNILIPMANLKRSSLLYDVRQQKPALALKEGVFSQDIPGITMRIGSKNANTQELYNILIYDHRETQLQATVLFAKRGIMKMSEDNRYLFLTLYDGSRYEELEKLKGYHQSRPHTSTFFTEEQITFDLNSFKFSRTDENLFKHHFEMLNVIELEHSTDSLNDVIQTKYNNLYKFIQPYYFFTKTNADSVQKILVGKTIPSLKDSSYITNLSGNESGMVYSNALNNARTVRNVVEYSLNEFKELDQLRARHRIEWHRKFILSFACIVMFFIGAPLGSIIRKGGFGLPIVVSVLMYVCYHIVSLSGEKAAKTMAWSPFEGMWFGIGVFVPLGLFLTWKAASDSGIFEMGWYKKLFRLIVKSKQEQK